MSLPSILVRSAPSGAHRVLVFYAGPDKQHRAYLGKLTARPDEAHAIVDALVASGYDSEHLEDPAPTADSKR